MPITVKAEFVLDVDCPKAADLYFARLTEMLMERDDMRSPLLAACGTVRGSVSMPLVTDNDAEDRWEELTDMARRLNRHATLMEQQTVEARIRLAEAFGRDLRLAKRAA